MSLLSDNKRRPPQPSPSETRSEAIGQLQNGLGEALNVFTTEDRLKGQLEALWALDRFLHELGTNPRLRRPLLSVISDLTDSDREGAEKPLDELVNMVWAAAALDTAIKAGMRMQLAAGAVVEAAGRAMTANQLITYRKSLQRRDRVPSLAAQKYQELCKQSAEQWGHLSPKEQIKEALDGIRRVIVPAQKV